MTGAPVEDEQVGSAQAPSVTTGETQKADENAGSVIFLRQDPQLSAVYQDAFTRLLKIVESRPDKYPSIGGVSLGIVMTIVAVWAEVGTGKGLSDFVYAATLIVGATLVLGSGVIRLIGDRWENAKTQGTLDALARSANASLAAKKGQLKG